MTNDAITDMIAQLLNARAADASICPSEVARALAPDQWRALMPQVRAVAADLALAGALRITQGSVEIAPGAVLAGLTRGPLRLRRAP
ncbi:DUF3253 domain-containing protein [Gemmatimonas groenlandica]|uniref:DUF3253 domain-containing protein n=1 Tax=Gemmatimonas groenlandica TaxID=2732249 RepID=A0A6M4IUG4_9BACT|nr:DUF3253 domain-containing protein [Gemmatimonas groenlandica]QJR37136.1 DUF3253 domain-containing protein [Gemmatimonas groenlandica]